MQPEDLYAIALRAVKLGEFDVVRWLCEPEVIRRLGDYLGFNAHQAMSHVAARGDAVTFKGALNLVRKAAPETSQERLIDGLCLIRRGANDSLSTGCAEVQRDPQAKPTAPTKY